MKEFVFGFKIAAAIQQNFNTAFSSASSQILRLNQRMQENKAVSKGVTEAFKLGVLSAKSYENAICKLSQNYDVLKNKANSYLRIQGKVNQNRISMSSSESNMLSLVGSAYAFSFPVRQAIEFETAMSDVRKVVDFADDGQFQQMNKDILELSQKLPMTANDLAAIVAAGGQSGIAQKDLLNFAEAAAKMGTAFDISASEAGDMMAKWRTSFSINQGEVEKLADKINYLSNKTAASAPLISDVVTRIGPLGAVGGMASGEIAALGASLVGSGIQSDVVATGIKNLILTMVAGESATKGQKEAFADLGFNATEMAKRMQTDAKGAIVDLMKAIQHLDKEKQAAMLQNLFGKESIGAIAPLLSNLAGLEKNLSLVADGGGYVNSMQDEFNTKADTTSNKLKLMQNSFNAVTTAVGNGVLPALKSMLDTAMPLAKVIGDFVSRNSELVGGVLLTFGVVTSLGVAANVLAWMYNGVALTVNGVSLAFATANTFMVEHAVATKLATGAAKVWNITKLIGTGIMKADIVQFTVALGKMTAMKALYLASATATGIWTAAQWAWNIAMTANPIGLVMAGIAGLIAIGYTLYANWDTIKSFFITLWDNPTAAIDTFCNSIRDKFMAAGNWLSEKWASIKNMLSSPIFGSVNITASGNGDGIAHNANGGIYGRGAFLTTFAERSGESAIPHTPTARNIGLLAETNRIMGNPLGGGTINATFSPTINVTGGDAGQLQATLENEMQRFKRMLTDLQNQQRRTSYA